MKEKGGFFYIMANWTGEVIYKGVTSNLLSRVYEHKHKLKPGFTSKYNLTKLVYYEEYGDIVLVIEREKKVKKWRRAKTNKLVNKMNPKWEDLSDGWYEDSSVCYADVRNDGVYDV